MRTRNPALCSIASSLLFVLACAGCSSDEKRSPGGGDAGGEPDAAGPMRPEGPTADVAELTGGNGIFLGAASATALPSGWVETEYAVEGTAVSYTAEGDALPNDGEFVFSEGQTADYRTRIVVRRPADASDFNGTVLVEWLNVSGGVDANPDFAYLADEILRGGYAWVGVSAQLIGVEGGPVLVGAPVGEGIAGVGLRALDAERYGDLHHPGDAFAYDIYTQVARTLRAGNGGVLGDLEPSQILAVGESQSGFMLTTYVNGVHPLVRQYDGFLIHSRGSGTAPLGVAGMGVDLPSGLGLGPTRIRTDLEEPVFMFESETDVLGVINFFPARQPDTNRIRTWEVAGTAHADAYLLGPTADSFECGGAINDGPQHFVVKAALRHLVAWARGGAAPPEAEPIEVDESGTMPVIVRDENGNALGGVRTPHVDVPVDTLSGDAAGGSIACLLFGSTTPLPADRIAELYASRDAYVDAYTEAADAAIAAGFVLEDDRDALLADAQPGRVGN